MSETIAKVIEKLRERPLRVFRVLAAIGLAGAGLALQPKKDSNNVEVAAVGASNTEQTGAHEGLSRQAEIEYGDSLLNQARSAASPLARAECNRIYYFTPKTDGPVIQVHVPISANRSTVTQDPNIDIPEENKFFVEYKPVTDTITGEAEQNPDGTTVVETRAYDPDDYNIRYEPLSSVPNSTIETCVVALQKPDKGDPDIYGRILAPDNVPDNWSDYVVSVGGITFAEPETDTGSQEPLVIHDGDLSP